LLAKGNLWTKLGVGKKTTPPPPSTHSQSEQKAKTNLQDLNPIRSVRSWLLVARTTCNRT
jgi:hypothetical protein